MFAKTTEKTAWKIISDPVADERQWMAAAEVVKETPLPGDVLRTAVNERMSDGAQAWLASFGGLFAGAGVFFIAFLVLYSVGGAFGIHDSLTLYANWLRPLIWMIGIPIIGCSIAGYFQRPRAADQRWTWILPAFPWIALGALGFMSSLGAPIVLALVACGVVAAQWSFAFGRHMGRWWQAHLPRMKFTSAAMPLVMILSLVIWGVVANVFFGKTHHYSHSQMEASEGAMVINFVTFITVLLSAAAAKACGSRQLSTSVLAAFTLQAPLILFYLGTFASAAVYLVWSATTGSPDAAALSVSAASLALTSLSTTGGGLVGWGLNRVSRSQ